MQQRSVRGFVFVWIIGVIAACTGDDGHEDGADAASVLDSGARHDARVVAPDAGADAFSLAVNGTHCARSAECGSGQCVDGVCCESACDGSCVACVASSTGAPDGTCAPVRAGEDPGNECTSGPGSCTEDTCDGAGACRRVADGTTCREALGTCDRAEVCAAGVCPPDAREPSGYVCRAASGACDTPEACDGTSPACPSDARAAAGTECRAAAGPCDVAETCSGASAECPADTLRPASTACRAAAGDCDVAEVCDGSSAGCPSDAYRPSMVECRSSAGVCDVAETCSGTSAACPPDAFRPAMTVCRSTELPCDVAEVCTGASAECPPDLVASTATVCRGAEGACDLAEHCDGVAKTCPTNALAPATTECRPSAGPCDVPELCSGTSVGCPSDGFASGGTSCRASAGACDLAESCTGSSAACPADAFRPAGTVCRPVAGVCDAAESCTGAAAACPTDTFLAPPPTVCSPYVCGGASCRTTCTSNADCARDGKTACVAGACVRGRIAFVTSTPVGSASFMGVSAADAACNAHAVMAGYDGVFRAWISDETNSAASRINHAMVPYVIRVMNSANITIADNWADLTDGTLDASFNRSEAGAPMGGFVFTGTTPTGAIVAGRTCSNWTSGSSFATGMYGIAGNIDGNWSQAGNLPCATAARFYCLEHVPGS